MKKLLLLFIVIGAIYQGWGTISNSFSSTEPLYDKPYIVVYGRESCGFTQQTLNDLDAANIPYEYKIVDEKAVASLLHSRMQISGIDTRRYDLPVVDVNNNLSVRPKSSSIISGYGK